MGRGLGQRYLAVTGSMHPAQCGCYQCTAWRYGCRGFAEAVWHGEQPCKIEGSPGGVGHAHDQIGCDEPCPLCLQRLHSGVLRDLERQNQKRENIRLLEEQIALTKQLTEEREKMLMEKGSQHS